MCDDEIKITAMFLIQYDGWSRANQFGYIKQMEEKTFYESRGHWFASLRDYADRLGEEMYLGTLDSRGNKVDAKRDYSKKRKKDRKK